MSRSLDDDHAGGRAPTADERAAPESASGGVASRGGEVEDRDVVDGLLRGEAWAADALYRRVQHVVRGTLRRTLRHDDADLEDLMQASFERMLRVLAERPLGGACNLPAWASAVTANVALDQLRRRTRERRIWQPDTTHEASDAAPCPERDVEARQRLEAVQAALGRMRADQAEALLLHDGLGHPLSEVADITGVTVAAAQSRLVRGRKDFHRRMRHEAKP